LTFECGRAAATVQASGTTLTGIFGVGPVIAAAVLGTAGDPSRFGDRDRFAAYNGTAPIEVSSGDWKIRPAVAERQPAPQPRQPSQRNVPAGRSP
jgi:transposase